MPDQAVLAEAIGTVDKVLPHQVFREGERGERQFLDHLETRHVAHLPPHDLEDPSNVNAAIVAWQIPFELRYPDGEVALKKLEQREVDAHFVLVVRDPER